MRNSPALLLRAALAAAAGLVLAGNPARAEVPRTLIVRGAAADMGETPVVVELKTPFAAGNYKLTPNSGPSSDAAPATIYADGGKTYLAVVLPRLSGSKEVTFTLAPTKDSEQGVQLNRQGSNIQVNMLGNMFTEYLTDSGPKPYYWPVIGPTGRPITRAYPMKQVESEEKDHPHQRSMWFTHGKVNGIDFWSEQTSHGSIKETSRPTVVSGAAVGVIHTTDDWLSPDGQKVCDDERVVRFYSTKNTRVLDFDITIKATAGPVTFGDTKEGMFGLRVASSMDVKRKQGGKITNAEGITDLEAWGKASPWVDYTGPVAGEVVGIAILNHPDSFRYPTAWHVRDYGLFAANPFGWHDFGRQERGDHTIPAGKSILFRYRVIFHKGETASADIPAAFKTYSQPPQLAIVGD
ncbi:MAG TPA: PmoA family protein [Isosphaeraceae bacterium]|jgi:hypothetical protein|nr:PmoA family protein [Isosphaeraceae bacterium]